MNPVGTPVTVPLGRVPTASTTRSTIEAIVERRSQRVGRLAVS
ncbi:hypothetical protein ACH4Q7_35240 [Streptomyces roseolus]